MIFVKGSRVVVSASNGRLRGEVIGFTTDNKVVVHLDGKPNNRLTVYENRRLEKEDSR